MNPYAERRYELFRADPRCHWCRKLTVFACPTDGRGFDRLATLDHLNPSVGGERRDARGHPRGRKDFANTVLACYACNTKRGEEHGTTEAALMHAVGYEGLDLGTVMDRALNT